MIVMEINKYCSGSKQESEFFLHGRGVDHTLIYDEDHYTLEEEYIRILYENDNTIAGIDPSGGPLLMKGDLIEGLGYIDYFMIENNKVKIYIKNENNN